MDALDFLQALQPGIADIVFVDPPFNLGKAYGRSTGEEDRRTGAEYRAYMTDILEHCVAVLSEGGALYLYHLPRWAMEFGSLLSDKLSFRHWIAISMKNGFVRGGRLYPAHYALLYFTKGKPGIFARPKIPPPSCPHCGEHLRDYGGYKKFVQNGINLSDVWNDLSPVRHTKYKNRRSNELPKLIPERAFRISGRKGGLVVDPFAGAGTALVAARELGMGFVACDREKECCDLIRRRVSEAARCGT